MAVINLPGQFVTYWQGSSEFQSPGMWLSEGAVKFRQAFDAGVYRGRGHGFSVAVDIVPGPALDHLEQLADDFAEVCSPGYEHTRLEARASQSLDWTVAGLRAREWGTDERP